MDNSIESMKRLLSEVSEERSNVESVLNNLLHETRTVEFNELMEEVMSAENGSEIIRIKQIVRDQIMKTETEIQEMVAEQLASMEKKEAVPSKNKLTESHQKSVFHCHICSGPKGKKPLLGRCVEAKPIWSKTTISSAAKLRKGHRDGHSKDAPLSKDSNTKAASSKDTLAATVHQEPVLTSLPAVPTFSDIDNLPILLSKQISALTKQVARPSSLSSVLPVRRGTAEKSIYIPSAIPLGPPLRQNTSQFYAPKTRKSSDSTKQKNLVLKKNTALVTLHSDGSSCNKGSHLVKQVLPNVDITGREAMSPGKPRANIQFVTIPANEQESVKPRQRTTGTNTLSIKDRDVSEKVDVALQSGEPSSHDKLYNSIITKLALELKDLFIKKRFSGRGVQPAQEICENGNTHDECHGDDLDFPKNGSAKDSIQGTSQDEGHHQESKDQTEDFAVLPEKNVDGELSAMVEISEAGVADDSENRNTGSGSFEDDFEEDASEDEREEAEVIWSPEPTHPENLPTKQSDDSANSNDSSVEKEIKEPDPERAVEEPASIQDTVTARVVNSATKETEVAKADELKLEELNTSLLDVPGKAMEDKECMTSNPVLVETSAQIPSFPASPVTTEDASIQVSPTVTHQPKTKDICNQVTPTLQQSYHSDASVQLSFEQPSVPPTPSTPDFTDGMSTSATDDPISDGEFLLPKHLASLPSHQSPLVGWSLPPGNRTEPDYTLNELVDLELDDLDVSLSEGEVLNQSLTLDDSGAMVRLKDPPSVEPSQRNPPPVF